MLQAIDEIKSEIASVSRQQQALLLAWKTETQIDGLKLEIHRQGAPAIRWRLKKKGSDTRKYIILFQNESLPLTNKLTPDSLEMISAFEHHRILVNAKSKSLHAMLGSMELALDELNRIPIETLEVNE